MVADDNSEEQKQADRLLKKSLVQGHIWNVVSAKWFKKWLSFIKLKETTTPFNSDGDSCNPGKIDNTDILKDGELRTEILEHDDYELIPKELFEMLQKKYGIISEKHIFERKVIKVKGAREDILKVEVFPLKLKIYLISSKTLKELEISKEKTVNDLEQKVKSELKISSSETIRLVIKCNDEYVVLPSSNNVSHELEMNQEVLVDMKRPNGWHYDVKNNRENGATAAISSGVSSSSAGNHYSSGSSTFNDRNFYRGSSHGRGTIITPGLRGLNNLGNTCFMNSAIQSLSNVPPLTDFFRSGEWHHQLNTKNPLGMDGEIASSYAELVGSLWAEHNAPFMPRRFKMAVGRFAPQFSGFQQQDAQELMAFLLDGLHEDLNRIKKKPYVEVKDSDGRPDQVVAREAWDNYLKRNDSIIVDLFHGQLRSELICPECSRISVTFDPFCYLSLPLPAEETPVTITLYRLPSASGHAPKPTKYSFRAFADISYRDFLKRLRRVADLSSTTELILGEPLQHTTVAFRVFPPSGVVDASVERTLHSPLPDHHSGYHRAPLNYVAFEVPQRHDEESLVWVELQQNVQYLHRPLLLTLTRADTAARGTDATREAAERELYMELASQLLPFVPTDTLAHTKRKVVKEAAEARRMETEDDNQPDEDADEEAPDGEEETAFRWESFSEAQKEQIGRMWCSLEQRYTATPKFVDVKSVRLRVTLSKSFSDATDHSSVSEMRSHGRGVQLHNCLDLFTKKETLGERDSWYCNKCKKHQRATKKFDLWKLPRVLVIHLKRFGSAHRLWRNKLNTKVFFPLSGLDLSKWLKEPREPNLTYNLVSVVNHFGSMGGGHYTANALNAADHSWYNFDDSSVSRITQDQVVSQNAYVLVYVREGGEQGTERKEMDMMETD